MRRLLSLSFVFVLISTPAFSGSETLYNRFDGKAVRVFIDGVKDSTEGSKVSTAGIRSSLAATLKDRKSIRFELLDAPDKADIAIAVDVRTFHWTDHDPVDMLVGLGGTALDAARVEDYARIEADFTVTDPKTGRELWKDRVLATVTKKPMSEAESVPLVSEDLAKMFVRQCFGKPKR